MAHILGGIGHGTSIEEEIAKRLPSGTTSTGDVTNYSLLSDTTLEFLALGGDQQAIAELGRRQGAGGDGDNGGGGGGGGAAPRTASQIALDRADAEATLQQAKAALQRAQADLQNATTNEEQLRLNRDIATTQQRIDLLQLQLDRDIATTKQRIDRDTLNASIAATKQRLEEIELEARLAFESQDKLLTKRLEAEKEMLTLRLDNDFRELLTTEIGAERRVLIQEQGETRRLAAELQGKDPFRQASLLGGQAQRGRTPAQLFGQQNQAFLNQPLPQANISAPFGTPQERTSALAGLQAQLTGAQQRPLQPQAPTIGLARGGVIEMSKNNGTFSMQKPVSFLVGEGAGVIPGITEVLTIGDGKVTVSPLVGGFQEGGTVTTQPQLIRIDGGDAIYYWDGSTYRHLTSADVFNGSGFTLADVVNVSSADANQFTFGLPITEAFDPATGAPDAPTLIRFGSTDEIYYLDPETGNYRWLTNPDAFNLSGFSLDQVVSIPESARQFITFGDDIVDSFGDEGPVSDTAPPTVPPVREIPPPEPPLREEPPAQPAPPAGPTQADILAGLQALGPGFAGLTEFVPRTQVGQFGGVNALRDFFSLQGQNFVQDPFSGQFRPFQPGLPEGVSPTAIQGAPTSFGAPVVNQGAFNLQNLATLGFDPALVRLGGQEDIFYRDPTTGELRQFGTPDIFEQSGFDLADVFNISPTGQNFQFGSAITSPLPLAPNANTSGPFRQPLIDPLTQALLFDPFQNASSLLQLQQSNPSAFLNLLSSFGTAGLDPIGFQSRLDLATPTGALDNPLRIGFTGTRL